MGPEHPLDPVSLGTVLRASTSARITWLKSADWALGRTVLPWVRPQPPVATPLAPASVRQLLVIRPGGIGDAVLALPLLREVARAFPQVAIDVVAERRNHAIFTTLGGILRRCDSADDDPWGVWARVRRTRYDLVFDLEQWHHLSALLAHASQAPVRVGFDTNARRNRCYTILVPYRHEDFEGESFLRMLAVTTGQEIAADWDRPFLTPPAAEAAWARQTLGGRPAIALALQGGIRERTWEPEKFLDVARRAAARGLAVYCLGGRRDASAARIREACPAGTMFDLSGRTTLLQSTALLSGCRLFIGTDSGLMHLAYAVGTPVVALFGAGIESKWAPRGSRARVLNRHLPCSPCTRFGYTPRCPIHVQCLRDITVDEVVRAAAELLPRA